VHQTTPLRVVGPLPPPHPPAAHPLLPAPRRLGHAVLPNPDTSPLSSYVPTVTLAPPPHKCPHPLRLVSAHAPADAPAWHYRAGQDDL